ncbi:MAG: GFA family protein [Woeseiaceae bacterium]|nr:GFA family protein [Woeseiaceae bacterium]
MSTHNGGCHCGAVRFEVEAPANIEATRCNCSICRMTGYLHLFVNRRSFRLLSGESDLQTYRFNTGVAEHYFCRHCGIKSFYVPRSHPEGFSVNVNCLVPDTIESVVTEEFDGRHWEENIAKLSPLSD